MYSTVKHIVPQGEKRNMTNTVKTANQIKLEFHQQGKTISSWAKENGYSRTDVSRVINGLAKGQRGKTLEIAVKLGMVIL
ncbi:unknown [[Mannheimia] succiniciproducens MBEL55E]|uniref:Phage-associated protein, BcepMu gp16 family n=2 Tax=Pasteurellaceae TaxID=712 RepID=Q65WE0_MANSM|nr:unknown [[Mannheimia] succiniciproducens MBEL55E]